MYFPAAAPAKDRLLMILPRHPPPPVPIKAPYPALLLVEPAVVSVALDAMVRAAVIINTNVVVIMPKLQQLTRKEGMDTACDCVVF